MTSSTAPGVTHRWRGRQIGEYIMRSVMQPTTATGSRCPVPLRGAQKRARRKVAPGMTAPPSGRSIRIQALGNMRVEPRADTLDGMSD
jgi:hypothetical protein